MEASQDTFTVKVDRKIITLKIAARASYGKLESQPRWSCHTFPWEGLRLDIANCPTTSQRAFENFAMRWQRVAMWCWENICPYGITEDVPEDGLEIIIYAIEPDVSFKLRWDGREPGHRMR